VIPLLLWQLPLGFLLASIIGYLGYRRQALSKSGVVGAIITGGLLFGFGGLSGAALLLVFFISSSVLSRFKESNKETLAEKFSKGSQRDLGQALANAGAAAVCMTVFGLTQNPLWWVAAAAALATANADTWATELGVLSKAPPRLITNGNVVEVGTSGGVSIGGTLAALAGALLVGITAFIAIILDPALSSAPFYPDPLLLIITLAGLIGSLFDSLLGATVQAIYYCDTCQKETERHPTHRCGSPTRQLRGWAWLDNDWVNFLATAVGAGVAVLIIWIVK
jgi:uncharacterized protein (TIGR00297 family)